VEIVKRRLRQQGFIVTVLFQKHDLSLVGANQQSLVWKPGVAGVVVGDVSFLLVDLGMSWLQNVVVGYTIEFECVVSCHQH
jgi:hypothetical protein